MIPCPYGPPLVPSACHSGRPRRAAAIRRRLPGSKDWTTQSRAVSRLRWITRTSSSSSGSPIERKYVGCFVSGNTAIRRPDSRDSRRARSTTSWNVSTRPRPSKTVLRLRTSGSRSTVRSVRSSRSVGHDDRTTPGATDMPTPRVG
ncbi:hypothetical protein SBADM41S_04807 [Streptomyces badius]